MNSRPSNLVGLLIVGLVAAVGLAACSSVEAPVAPRTDARPSADVRQYLKNPLQGYELNVSADDALKIDRGFAGLISSGDSATALKVARQLLARDDQLLPAIVLEQQVTFLAADYASVVERLAPMMPQDSTPVAATLLLARSLEIQGQVLEAFELYKRLSGEQVARARAAELEPRAVELLTLRLEELLEDGQVDQAGELVAGLEQIVPGTEVAWEARRDVSMATEDGEAELAVRRKLSSFRAEGSEALQRLAQLEVELGDPTQGVDILQRLVDQAPGDFALREALDSAKFSWRLNMLPPEVADVAKSDAVTRADFATLLYWVVPGARAGNAQAAQIATDVPVDHPQRREVLRILNLRLMPMADAALRTFEPDRNISITAALDVLLRVPAHQEIPLACTRGYDQKRRHRSEATCEAAVRCEIVPDASACAETGALSGAVAREMVRRTLNMLGGQRR